MAQEKRQVRFVRKNGRIIPIRQKENNVTRKAGLAGYSASLVGGTIIGAKAAADVKSGASLDHMFMMTNQYSDELKRAKAGLAVYGRDVTSPTKSASKLIFGTERTMIGIGAADEGVFAHELGHATAARIKGSFNYRYRRAHILAARAGKKSFLYRGIQGHFTRIPMEIEATVTGIKLMRKNKGIGLIKALGKSKLALLGQATYIGTAIGTTAVAASLFHRRRKK